VAPPLAASQRPPKALATARLLRWFFLSLSLSLSFSFSGSPPSYRPPPIAHRPLDSYLTTTFHHPRGPSAGHPLLLRLLPALTLNSPLSFPLISHHFQFLHPFLEIGGILHVSPSLLPIADYFNATWAMRLWLGGGFNIPLIFPFFKGEGEEGISDDNRMERDERRREMQLVKCYEDLSVFSASSFISSGLALALGFR